ncbi:MAG: TolC family protein [Muribaculaceae bacterium]|nr:TolC family protein [Muribaculaceae bacterium]
MKKIYSLAIIFLALTTVAQDYETLLKTIVANNPDIAAMEASIESEVLSIKSDNNLPDTDVDFEHQWGPKEVGNKWSVGISQGFEWPGIYSERRKAAQSATDAMAFLKRSNYLDKLLEVKLLFIDIVNTRKNIAIMDEVLNHMTQLKEKYHNGYHQGEVTILDVNKIDIEHISVSRRCNELRTQLTILENSLAALNGGKDCSAIIATLNDYPQDMILSEDDYVEMIKQNDPMLGYNSFMTKSQASTAKAAKLKNLPGFSLGYLHVNELGTHFNGFKIGLSLPLFSNRNKVAASKALLRSLENEETSVEVAKLSAMYSDRAKVLTLHKEMNEYRPMFEDSNNIALLKKALDGGEISLLTYLQEVNYFLKAQREYMDVVYQYHYSLARLNRYELLK